MARTSSSNWVPLGSDKTYREGFLRLQGWMTFSVLLFFTAGLVVMNELLIINVEDQDFRDMLFDYRVTRPGVSYQHKHFVNGYLCCHSDPGVFPAANCSASAAMRAEFSAQPHACPPTVVFTCPDLASPACNELRATLYPAAGLNASTGLPQDCSTAGRVLIRAIQAAQQAGGGGYQLSSSHLTGSLLLDEASFDAAGIVNFVHKVVAAADPMFVLPSVPLSKAVSIEAAAGGGGAAGGGEPQAVPLTARWQPEEGDRWGAFGWPWELWPWPPSAACSNTGQPAAMWLEGDASIPFSPFQPNISHEQQPSLTLTLLSHVSQHVTLPQYQILPAATADSLASAWQNIGPFARYFPDRLHDPASGEGLRQLAAELSALTTATTATAGVTEATSEAGSDASKLQQQQQRQRQQQVKVMALSAVSLRLGLAAPLASSCEAWQLHKPETVVQYGQQVWSGSLPELLQLNLQQVDASGVSRTVAVSLRDVTEPQPLQLPHYGGELYVYVALVLGGLWLFTTAPLIIMLGVMVINVQRNRGVPQLFYKYMRKYRGW